MNKIKVYLSSRFSRKNEMKVWRDLLHQLGFDVTSSWLDTTWEEDKDREHESSVAPPEYREKYAHIDAQDVIRADCIVAFTEPPKSGGRGGRHVEFGIAIALNKVLIVIGHRENVFHHTKGTIFFNDGVDVQAVAQAINSHPQFAL